MGASTPIGAAAAVVAVLAVVALGTDRPRAPARPQALASSTTLERRPERGSPHRGGPLDLNRATAVELESLPRVGPALAARIVLHRETRGPFLSLDDLDAVKGVGPRLLETLRPHLRVAAPTTGPSDAGIVQ